MCIRDRAQAQELLDCLWMKFPETNYINTESHSQIASGFPAQQQIMVGGQTADGRDASNPLSYMCLQASINTLPVSYTHLDVYKRQISAAALFFGEKFIYATK